MLGRYVRVKVTSPIHSKHPQQGFTYGLNYGEINFVTARKRETLNAFVMGIDHPVKTFDGRVSSTRRASAVTMRRPAAPSSAAR